MVVRKAYYYYYNYSPIQVRKDRVVSSLLRNTNELLERTGKRFWEMSQVLARTERCKMELSYNWI